MKTATQTTTATWLVEYNNHDMGANGGHFLRKTEKDAKRSAELLRQCGYQDVSYRQWTR